jgi:hypothetical protein
VCSKDDSGFFDIIPGAGIGQVRFGLLESQLIDAIGPPDKTYQQDGTRHFIYNHMQMNIWFDAEGDLRLEWISCSHPRARIGGRALVGMTIEDAMEHLKAILADQKIEFDNYRSFERHVHGRPDRVPSGIQPCD